MRRVPREELHQQIHRLAPSTNVPCNKFRRSLQARKSRSSCREHADQHQATAIRPIVPLPALPSDDVAPSSDTNRSVRHAAFFPAVKCLIVQKTDGTFSCGVCHEKNFLSKSIALLHHRMFHATSSDAAFRRGRVGPRVVNTLTNIKRQPFDRCDIVVRLSSHFSTVSITNMCCATRFSSKASGTGTFKATCISTASTSLTLLGPGSGSPSRTAHRPFEMKPSMIECSSGTLSASHSSWGK